MKFEPKKKLKIKKYIFGSYATFLVWVKKIENFLVEKKILRFKNTLIGPSFS